MRNCSIRVGSITLLLGLSLTAFANQIGADEKTEIRVVSAPIPAPVEYQISRLVSRGLTKPVHQGHPGVIRKFYEVTVKGGKPVSKKLVRQEIIPAEKTVVLLSSTGFTASRHSYGRGKVMTMTATAYDPSPATIGRWATGRTKTGRRATYGVVAVDPRIIPLNTMVYVEGYGLALACDTGSAIKGKRIDLCYDSKRVADAFGRRKVTVHILK
jgi:3D (Asp-Asp-Asp) domain-containing protein